MLITEKLRFILEIILTKRFLKSKKVILLGIKIKIQLETKSSDCTSLDNQAQNQNSLSADFCSSTASSDDLFNCVNPYESVIIQIYVPPKWTKIRFTLRNYVSIPVNVVRIYPWSKQTEETWFNLTQVGKFGPKIDDSTANVVTNSRVILKLDLTDQDKKPQFDITWEEHPDDLCDNTCSSGLCCHKTGENIYKTDKIFQNSQYLQKINPPHCILEQHRYM